MLQSVLLIITIIYGIKFVQKIENSKKTRKPTQILNKFYGMQ